MISNKLIVQQNNIIESNKRKIVVYAGPGSGKTFTLIKKMNNDIAFLFPFEGIIALSFTREASKQIESKLNLPPKNTEFFQICTTDAFAVKMIKLFYKKISKRDINFEVIISDKFQLENYYVKNNVLTDSMLTFYKEWLSNLHKGTIIISFRMYIYLESILRNEYITLYMKKRYKNIYIDEAQDLNTWQFNFFDSLINKCDLNALFVGDHNQCIYQFRGSNPNLFNKLTEEGYEKYVITESVRCPYNILAISNALIKNEKINLTNVTEITFNQELKTEELKSSSILFLASTRKECASIQQVLKNRGIENIIFVNPLYLGKVESKIQNEIHQIILFLINKIESLKYGEIDKNDLNPDFKTEFSYIKACLVTLEIFDFTKEKKRMEVIKSVEDIAVYINNYFNLNMEKEIINQLQSSEIYLYYLKIKKVNRIMTIHQSKGLEADFVYLKIGSEIMKGDTATKNKYFVAFTRAKKKLNISAESNVISFIKDIWCD